MSCLYHVSAEPIDKFSLLTMAAEIYGLDKEIVPVDEPRINRALNSDRFREKTGYQPEPWSDMLRRMRSLQG
jgi:dTDP-4-dehydrorhamnose reductase